MQVIYEDQDSAKMWHKKRVADISYPFFMILLNSLRYWPVALIFAASGADVGNDLLAR